MRNIPQIHPSVARKDKGRCVFSARDAWILLVSSETPVIRKPIYATATTPTCLSDRRSDIDASIFARDRRNPLWKYARLNRRRFAPGCYCDQDNVNWWRRSTYWKYTNAIDSFFIELFAHLAQESYWFLNMFSLKKSEFLINYCVQE